MASSSLKKMSGREGQQEGIYASSDLSMPGALPPQNDLGLTLLPGSQYQTAAGEPLKPANETSRGGYQIESLLEHSKSSFQGIRKDGGNTRAAALGGNRDMSQTLVWIEERRRSLADRELEEFERKQRRVFQPELLQQIGKSRFRYGHKVRGGQKAPKDCRSHKRRKAESSSSAEFETDKDIFTRTSSPCDDAASPSGKSATQPSPRRQISTLPRASLPQPRVSEQPLSAPTLCSNAATKHPPSSLTGLYPQPSARTISRNVNLVSDESSSTAFHETENGQPCASQELMNITRDRAYKRIQEELRQTKTELHNKTRAESDAQQIINELRKAYNDLLNSMNAHPDLQKAHSRLLLEHRQVLDSYNTLARVHNACRGASSKKLAQRIIEAGSSSNDSAYASVSPSIAAHSIFASNANTDTATRFSYPRTPLIDLTTTALLAPWSPDAATAPNMEQRTSSIVRSERTTDQGNSNYANMNGFDDEANEMYDLLWENEMIDWDGGKEGKTGM